MKILKRYLKKSYLAIRLFREYSYDYYRYIRYSGLFSMSSKPKRKVLISSIISQCHSIEKGLTMPEFRLGFGKDKTVKLIEDCESYIRLFDGTNIQLLHAVSVLLEYRKVHAESNYNLEENLLKRIDELSLLVRNTTKSNQTITTEKDYFKDINSSFDKFSNSRKSVRNYTKEDVPIDVVKKAIDLATNAPTSCNRQGTRVYVYTEKEKINKMLDIQGGNRGFGHLTNKLILITAEQGIATGFVERNMGFVDGGMFAMNLLYALHFNKIGACSLNCNLSNKNDRKLRKLSGIKNSEVFVVMISCGYIPTDLKIAISKRFKSEDIITVV